jgi:hypothetical protein
LEQAGGLIMAHGEVVETGGKRALAFSRAWPGMARRAALAAGG